MRALLLYALVTSATAHADPYAKDLDARRARFRKEAARPQAIVPLLGVLELWELLQDRAPLIALLDEAASAPAQRADVRARAQFLRSIVLDRLGRTDEATKARDGLGLVTRWQVAGPFDNEGRAGHASAFGPEKDLGRFDAKQSWDGKERKVGWRLVTQGTQGLTSLDAALRPDTAVTAYATVAVKSPKAQKIAMRVGSTGAVKAWVNGRIAIDHDVYRPVRIDQDAGAGELSAGWNRVTVKLSAAEAGGWSMFVRLTRPDGGPLDGLEFSTTPERLADGSRAKVSNAKVSNAKLPAVADLGRELQKWAETHAGDAEAQADFGLYQRYVAPEDPERRLAADALAQAAKLKPTAQAFGELAQAESDPNEQRKTLEEGLAHARGAEAAPLETALGELYAHARRERRAEAMWLKAVADDPSWWPARIKLAELNADRGLPALAARQLAEVDAKLSPPPLKLLRAEAQLAMRRGRRAEASGILERISEAERDDADALRELFSFARARGAVDKALALLDRVAGARNDVVGTALDRAELLDGVGRSGEAHGVLEAALKIAPEDARLLERDGRLLHRLGREPEAVANLQRALELRPQNPELRAYLAELTARLAPQSGEKRSDLSRWAEDVPRVIARAKKKPADGTQARVLFDSTVVRVHPNGLSETFNQRVVQILDERGARAEGDFDIRYTPDTQSVDVRAARVYRPSGKGYEILEAISTDDQDLSEPWYGLYYDVRGQVVHFAQLQPGDVVDVEYTVSDVGRRNLFADYFGDVHFFQEDVPRLESRYVLIAPKAKQLYFNQPRLGVTKSEEIAGDERVITFRGVDLPKIDGEPGMPGFSELSSYVHVSTYKSWADVARWYEGLVRQQLEPNAAITRAAKEAVRGLTDDRAKIRAIYDLVVKRTRYVGLEFGIHGYQPYRVSQVFARKFGDCKDKASLLVAMLKEAGITASLVLARTRHGGDLDAEPASLAPFDHAIAWVPKYDLYLDGTAEFSGAEELPSQDQDIPVLQVMTGKLVRTPVLPPAKNRVVTEWRVVLDESGAAQVDEKMIIAGEAAHDWRNHYQAAGERAEKYEQAWNGKHPGARLDALEMEVEDLEKPVAVRARLTVPHWGRPDGDALLMPALGREADMLRSYARLSERKHDLVLGYPWRQEERVAIALPAGFAARRLPEARTVEAPFGKFTIKAEARGNEVVVTGVLEVNRHRIAVADYAAFRKFCAEVDNAVAQDLVLAREKRAEVTK